MTRPGKGETEVQGGIFAYLSSIGYPRIDDETQLGYGLLQPAVAGWCWRNNTGELKNPRGVPVRYGCPGSPDILLVQAPHGRLVGIECKREVGGVQDKKQERWEAAVTALGAIYILAPNVEAVRADRRLIVPRAQWVAPPAEFARRKVYPP